MIGVTPRHVSLRRVAPVAVADVARHRAFAVRVHRDSAAGHRPTCVMRQPSPGRMEDTLLRSRNSAPPCRVPRESPGGAWRRDDTRAACRRPASGTMLACRQTPMRFGTCRTDGTMQYTAHGGSSYAMDDAELYRFALRVRDHDVYRHALNLQGAAKRGLSRTRHALLPSRPRRRLAAPSDRPPPPCAKWRCDAHPAGR